MKCVVVRPPSQDACGAPALYLVRWAGDGEKATGACLDCAVYLRQLAGEYHTSLTIERLKKEVPK